jgi:thiamine pyrophosphate-dependent acetolactate synthase large subunit-like protein
MMIAAHCNSRTASTGMTANQTCGQAAIALLEAHGVDTVFGIPGVHTLELYRGLAESRIRHVAVRHEQGAGFMADGYARASGRPGVCVVITGPGLLNAATAIGQAFSDSVPVLALSSVNARDDLGKGRGRLHEITSQQATMAPLTAFSRTVDRPDGLAPAMADAFAAFRTGRPRPVHLEIPLDVLQEAAPPAAPAAAPSVPAPNPAEITAAARLIDEAERPFLIAGGGTVDCAEAVRALVDKAGLLACMTVAGKGVVPDDHPQCVGGTMAYGPVQEALAAADLVIAIGTELAETDSWTDRVPIKGRLIRVDIDPVTLKRDYPPTLGLRAEAGAVLARLVPAVAARPERAAAAAAQAAGLKKLHRGSLGGLALRHGRVLDALRQALPEDGIVASDMTQIAYTANHWFPCRRPRCWFHPNGFGTLGYALPAAIGAKLACPDRAVVALAGDAGLLFTVQELGTAAELGLPLAILLWNNDSLGQIAGDMVARGIPAIGVKQKNPDFLALARAFGCHAVRPDSLAGLGEALTQAFAADRPTLIEVRQDSPFLG